MELNVYEFEIVVRKRVRIAAKSEASARNGAQRREQEDNDSTDTVEDVVLISARENVDLSALNRDDVDCITFSD